MCKQSLLSLSLHSTLIVPSRVGFLPSPLAPHRASSCHQSLLKPSPPFISARLFLEKASTAPFQLPSLSFWRSLGDSFSVQTFAFHEYAIIKVRARHRRNVNWASARPSPAFLLFAGIWQDLRHGTDIWVGADSDGETGGRKEREMMVTN